MSHKKDNNQSHDLSLNCSTTKCSEDENKHKLQCVDCKRFIHYRCTELPAYQIQAFIEKRIKRHYFCSNCIVVPAELERIVNPLSKDQQEINRLRRDIKGCENLTRVSEENAELTRQIVSDQLKKFDDKRFESYIDKKFNQLEDTLTNSFKDQQKNQTYSDILKKDTQNDFQTIIRVAKIEEKKEERDHDQRKKNIIVHGAHEESPTQEEQVNMDKTFVDNLLKDVAYKVVPKYIGRVGNKAEGKSRPLKIVLNTDEEKRKLFSNLKALKGVDKYQKVSISDDFTIAERELIKVWAKKAKEKNEVEPPDSNIIWRVRGNPTLPDRYLTRGKQIKLLKRPYVRTTRYGINSMRYQMVLNWNNLQKHFDRVDPTSAGQTKVNMLLRLYLKE